MKWLTSFLTRRREHIIAAHRIAHLESEIEFLRLARDHLVSQLRETQESLIKATTTERRLRCLIESSIRDLRGPVSGAQPKKYAESSKGAGDNSDQHTT